MTEPQLLFGIVLPAAALAFAVPLALAPVRWARALRWPVAPRAQGGSHAAERALGVYFARCLAACVAAFGVAFAAAAWSGPVPPVLGLQAVVLGLGLTLVHAAGALEGSQPWTETVEIGLYGALTLWAARVWWQL